MNHGLELLRNPGGTEPENHDDTQGHSGGCGCVSCPLHNESKQKQTQHATGEDT